MIPFKKYFSKQLLLACKWWQFIIVWELSASLCSTAIRWKKEQSSPQLTDFLDNLNILKRIIENLSHSKDMKEFQFQIIAQPQSTFSQTLYVCFSHQMTVLKMQQAPLWNGNLRSIIYRSLMFWRKKLV